MHGRKRAKIVAPLHNLKKQNKKDLRKYAKSNEPDVRCGLISVSPLLPAQHPSHPSSLALRAQPLSQTHTATLKPPACRRQPSAPSPPHPPSSISDRTSRARKRAAWFIYTRSDAVCQRAALQARFRSRTSQVLALALSLPCESTLRLPLPLFLPDIIMRI